MKSHIILAAFLVAFSLCVAGQESSESTAPEKINSTKPLVANGLVKISLTDFAWGKYSLSYERVIKDYLSAQLTISGIGMTSNHNAYSIASPTEFQPLQGPVIPADIKISQSGWNVTASIRKYGWVDEGTPDGFYASVFGTIGKTSVDADEHIGSLAFDPDTISWSGDPFFDEIDHTVDFTRWGFGLTIGYQWLTKNGIGLDLFCGPMFRGMSKIFVMDEYTNDEAERILYDRFTSNYYVNGSLNEIYRGNPGPWFSGGLSISMIF